MTDALKISQAVRMAEAIWPKEDGLTHMLRADRMMQGERFIRPEEIAPLLLSDNDRLHEIAMLAAFYLKEAA